MRIGGPFGFTKGCPVMRIDGRSFGEMPKKFLPAVRSLPNGDYILGRYAEAKQTLLFDLEKDPDQLSPLHDPAVEERMIRLMVDLMKQSDAPAEQYARVGLEAYL